MHHILTYPLRAPRLPASIRSLYVRLARRAWEMLVRGSVIRDVPDIGLMKLNPADLIGSRLFFYGIWEPAISQFLRKHFPQIQDMVAIDIGANIGYYTLMFSHLVGSHGTVYSIEPSLSIRQSLEQNIALNGLSNIRVIPYGISNRAETRLYHLDTTGRNLGASHFGDVCTEDELQCNGLQLRRLTEVISAGELARTAIIKIDVEGMEYPVLRDLLDTLPLFPRKLMILAELRFAGDGKMESLTKDLIRNGFETYLIPNRYDSLFYATRKRDPPERVQDVAPGQHDLAFVRK